MKALVLAGGLGSRLRERVPDVPKPMAQINGKPFLEFLFDKLVDAELEKIIVSVGYKADVITNHFGQEYKNIPLEYVYENEPLGTGGAVLNAISEHDNSPILVLNGDTFLDLDYKSFIDWFNEQNLSAAIVLREVESVSRYGRVLISDNRVVGFEEKGASGSGFVNAGIYILVPKLFDSLSLPEKFSLEVDFFQKNVSSVLAGAFVTDRYFIDIGIPEDYDKAQTEIPKYFI